MNPKNQEKIMFISDLIESFRRGEISHDEMWDTINRRLASEQELNICLDPELGVLHELPIVSRHQF